MKPVRLFAQIAVLFLPVFCWKGLRAQEGSAEITVTRVAGQSRYLVQANGKPFTEFLFPDTLAKPVLYPIYASDGQLITRGFPMAPRAGEPTDHPHHLGLWMNYENVNGLDFWNNSFAIPAEKRNRYGWIRTDSILETGSGKKGRLTYRARWTDQQQQLLLTETTTFIFSATNGERVIDRITTLTAAQDILMPDAKDGFLGLRVTRELQIPSTVSRQFTDNKGIVTTVAATDSISNGNYLTSEGKEGDSAWATRGNWCLLYGKKKDDMISIAILDHPANPGYPTYWHARGYGLFAANPLGQQIFSKGRQALNFHLARGESVRFRYRIVIAAGKERLSTGRIGELAAAFASQP
jgi:hypothetical protein